MIHNHGLEENPQMIFLHVKKIDKLDNITQDITDILSSDTDSGCI